MKVRILGIAATLSAFLAAGCGQQAVKPVNAAEPQVAVKGADPAPTPVAGKSDHTMFGGAPNRNMVNFVDTGLPDKYDGHDAKSLLWKADLGSRAYGGPVIAGGKIFVGTNNERPRNMRDSKKNSDGDVEPIDKGILMVFDEKTGKFLWQSVHDKLEAGMVLDWPKEGLCATPLVDGDKVFYTTNRCTLVCAYVDGRAKGATGIEKKYVAKDDAAIVWELDMIKDLGVFPHNMTAASPLLVGETIFVTTANGVDEGHINIPAPQAPSFVAVDKNTGKVIWKSSLPGKNIMHGQWSNPVYAKVADTEMVVFTGGDGWLYAFVPKTGELIWKFDANPKKAVYDLGGAGDKSDFIGTPVVHEDKLYIGTGQDPEHFSGVAHFYAIDLKKCLDNAKKNKDKDVSPEIVDKVEKTEEGKTKVTGKANPDSAVHWHYGGNDERDFVPRNFKFGRTLSSACIVDGVIYIAELQGYLHCLDLKTGKKFWQFDLKGAIWGSPYYVDGKIFLGTEGGDMFVFKHSKTPVTIDEIDIPTAKTQKEFNDAMKAKRAEITKAVLLSKNEFEPIRSTIVVANGVLYVMSENTLYAFGKKK